MYRATDGVLFSEPATVTIFVDRRSSIANADAYWLPEETTLVVPAEYGLLVNDESLHGPLVALLASLPSHSTVSISSDGSFTYIPVVNFYGQDTFTYEATDGTLPARAIVTIVVTKTDDAPQASNDTYITTVGEPLEVLPGVGRSTYAETIIGDGPSAYWRFEGRAGTTAMDVTGNVDGTYRNGVSRGQKSPIAGLSQFAAKFDGVNDFSESPYSPVVNPAAGFTIEAWVRVDGGDGRRRTVISSRGLTAPGKPTGFAVYVNDKNQWQMWTGQGRAGEGRFVDGPTITLDEWTHVVMTFQPFGTSIDGLPSGELRLYVDGALTTLSTGVAYAANATQGLQIGADASGDTRHSFFDGGIDDVAIYGRTLTVSEIRGHRRAARAILAESESEFSGVQGQAGWQYGYFDVAADADGSYQPSKFTPFLTDAGLHSPTNFWNGNRWEWYGGAPPWTRIGLRQMTPNGTNSGAEHWVIRRWVSDHEGPAVLTGFIEKQEAGGDGVRTIMFVDGVPVLDRVIGAADEDVHGYESNVDLSVGTIVDYVVAPLGDDLFDEVDSSANIFDGRFGLRDTVKIGNAGWRYLDTVENGADYPLDNEGIRWNENGFNDSGWSHGYGLHGYGNIDANAVDTTIGFGSDPNAKHRTALFRNSFFVANTTTITSLTFKALFDDGAAVYINGTEVIRVNLPGEIGDYSLSTDTLALAPSNESPYRTYTISLTDYPSLLVDGMNAVAVELHQVASDIPDLAMYLELTATTRPVIDPQSSVLSNDTDADDDVLSAAVVTEPQHGTLDLRPDGTFLYMPNSGFTGVDQFTYRASDGDLYSAPFTVRIVVSSIGHSPQDLNADGIVNAGDVAFLVASYGKTSAAKAIEGDLDGDGRISLRDAIALRNAFSPAPLSAAAVVARQEHNPQPVTEGIEPSVNAGVRNDRRMIRRDCAPVAAATDSVLADDSDNSLSARRIRNQLRVRREPGR